MISVYQMAEIYLSHDSVQFFVCEVLVYFQKDALRKKLLRDFCNTNDHSEGM